MLNECEHTHKYRQPRRRRKIVVAKVFLLVTACGNLFLSILLFFFGRYSFVHAFRLRQLMVMQRLLLFSLYCVRLHNSFFPTSVSVFISKFSLCIGIRTRASCRCIGTFCARCVYISRNEKKMFRRDLQIVWMEFGSFPLFCLRNFEAFLTSEQTTEIATIQCTPARKHNINTFKCRLKCGNSVRTRMNGLMCVLQSQLTERAMQSYEPMVKTNKRYRMHVCTRPCGTVCFCS